MTPGPDAREHAGGPNRGPGRVPARAGAAAPDPVPTRPAQAPERPTLGGEGFSTVLDPGERPTVVTVSVALWLAGVVAAGVAAASMWAGQDGVRARFAAMVVERDAGTATDVVADAARYAFLATAGSVVLVAVLHTVLALLMRTGRVWARNLLLLTGVLGIVVAVLVQDLVADPARPFTDDAGRVALLLHAALVVPAAVTMLLPAASGWFRRVRVLR